MLIWLQNHIFTILIIAVLACNFSVIVNLIHMHRRGRRSRCGPSLGSSHRRAERVSMAEETDHLILLAIMTITFAVCSLPFTVRHSLGFYSRARCSLLTLFPLTPTLSTTTQIFTTCKNMT